MTIEYKYKKWRDVFMLCKPYVWYTIDPSRKDREDFIQALKEFHQQWGLLQFNEDFTMFMKIDPVVYINEVSGYAELSEGLIGEKLGSVKYEDFYTKSYDPKILEAQKEKDHQPELKPMPGLDIVDGKYTREVYTSHTSHVSATQSYDSPFDDNYVPPKPQTLFSEPKNEPNISTQKLEQLKDEKEDDFEF